jgi:hypothetical protein
MRAAAPEPSQELCAQEAGGRTRHIFSGAGAGCRLLSLEIDLQNN